MFFMQCDCCCDVIKACHLRPDLPLHFRWAAHTNRHHWICSVFPQPLFSLVLEHPVLAARTSAQYRQPCFAMQGTAPTTAVPKGAAAGQASRSDTTIHVEDDVMSPFQRDAAASSPYGTSLLEQQRPPHYCSCTLNSKLVLAALATTILVGTALGIGLHFGLRKGKSDSWERQGASVAAARQQAMTNHTQFTQRQRLPGYGLFSLLVGLLVVTRGSTFLMKDAKKGNLTN